MEIERTQTCVSVVSHGEKTRILVTADGEETYLNWKLRPNEKIEEGRTYRIVLTPE